MPSFSNTNVPLLVQVCISYRTPQNTQSWSNPIFVDCHQLDNFCTLCCYLNSNGVSSRYPLTLFTDEVVRARRDIHRTASTSSRKEPNKQIFRTRGYLNRCRCPAKLSTLARSRTCISRFDIYISRTPLTKDQKGATAQHLIFSLVFSD